MKRTLLCFLVLGFLLRLAVVLSGVGYDKELSFFDARDYERHALNLLAGNGLTNGKAWASRPPLYPLLIAGFYRLFGVSYLPIRIFQSLLSTLTILLVYLIGKRTFDKTPLRLGLFLCTIHPILILYCGNILTETTASFLLALVIWGLIASRFILAGLLFGLLLLTKASLVLFFPFLAGWCLFRKVPLRTFLVFPLACGLVLSPWVLRNYRLLDAFVPLTTNGGVTFWDANNPKILEDPSKLGLPADWIIPGGVTVEREGQLVQLDEVEGEHYLWQKGFLFVKSLILEQPRLFGWILIKKFLAAFSLHAGKKRWELFGYGLLYTMAFWGILLSLRRRPRPTLLYLIILHYVVTALIFWGRAKYRVVIEPYLMLFVGVFCVWVLEKRKGADRT